MTADPAVSAPPVTFALQHWVYGSVPEVGYSVRAQSPGVNLSFYARRLEGIYTPISGENLHGEDSIVDVAMVHPTGSGTELLFSIIGPGPPDAEYKRRTFVNHTAVVPVDALSSGELDFGSVEEAIRGYDRQHANAEGTVDALAVPAHGTEGPRTLPGRGIERYLTRA